jgi:hypothetical protein
VHGIEAAKRRRVEQSGEPRNFWAQLDERDAVVDPVSDTAARQEWLVSMVYQLL